jgi:serine/threonine protein kinase
MGIVGRKNLDSRGKTVLEGIEAAMEQPRRFLTHGARKIAVVASRAQGGKTRHASFAPLPPRLRSGELLDDFKIEQEIATGATATVYEAWQVSAQRVAALKVLSPHLGTDPMAAERFKAEAAYAERVEDPCIVPIYGSGKARGHYYYAMRLETGETAESLAASASTTDEGYSYCLARQFAGVARALERLHEKGIIHRDLKPENLLLGRDGSLLLSDFGSALDALDRSRTLERSLWGTLRYMSPEQFGPEADPYDARIDVYGLGLTLYEVATGANPFPGTDEEELARIKVTRIPPAPRAANSRLPLGLDAIIRHAVEPNPTLRYGSMEELAGDLERFGKQKRGHRR